MISMHEACQACQRLATPPNPVLALRELGPSHPGPGTLHLCQSCLVRRRRAHWSRHVLGDRVEAALARLRHHDGRFTYLQDPAGSVHLVRLRPAWVHAHEAPPSAPTHAVPP